MLVLHLHAGIMSICWHYVYLLALYLYDGFHVDEVPEGKEEERRERGREKRERKKESPVS